MACRTWPTTRCAPPPTTSWQTGCTYYFAYRKHCGNEPRQRIRRRLASLIGEADLVTVTPHYHRELAILEYRAAREVHSEGRAYKEIIGKMFFLDDDFNDKLTHFCAGLERFRISSREGEDRVDRLTRRLQESQIYLLEQYYAPPERRPPTAAAREP